MNIDKTLSKQNLECFDFEETKNNVNRYFLFVEKLVWELAKMNAQKGLSTKQDFSDEYQKQPYTPVGKDIFGLSAMDCKEEEIKKYISSYYWAKSMLTEKEQVYIDECFINRKYEDEIVQLLEIDSCDSNEFRILKRSAVYKIADFLGLLEEKKERVR